MQDFSPFYYAITNIVLHSHIRNKQTLENDLLWYLKNEKQLPRPLIFIQNVCGELSITFKKDLCVYWGLHVVIKYCIVIRALKTWIFKYKWNLFKKDLKRLKRMNGLNCFNKLRFREIGCSNGNHILSRKRKWKN